jgi:predicted RNA-binding Zn ribbon-like protein
MDHHERHRHEASLEESLAFVNTLEYDRDPQEHLDSVFTALAWFRDHSLLHSDVLALLTERFTDDPAAGERTLARIRKVRAGIRELLDATVEGRSASAAQLAVVNQALRTPFVYQLVPVPDGITVSHRHEGDPVDGALARLAEIAAREVSQGDPDRLRVCANEACRWVFYDTSRSGRRKWCDMASCGNRAKAARHRARQRAEDESAASTVRA